VNDDDFDIIASRAIEPLFYRAPHPSSYQPYEFQFAGAEYTLCRNHALIGDAPGVGKTLEGILVGNAIAATRSLVISPASLRLLWEREIWKGSTQDRVTTYPILKAKDGVSDKADYVITSYAMLLNKDILAALMALRWDHLILDEAHAIKDPKGNRRTRIICAPDVLRSVVGRITLLSGTILPNQPIECYNAIRLLNWEAINKASLASFRENYYDYGEGFVRIKGEVRWSDRVRNVPRNLADLQFRLRKNIMVRRLKKQVLHELPEKQWHPFPVETTAEIRTALKHPGWDKAASLYDLDPDNFADGCAIDGSVSTARRLLGEAKAPAVVAYIEELLRSGVEKVVVGAWHISVIDILWRGLAKYGVVLVKGDTPIIMRQTHVDMFQNNPGTRIILGQTIPLGEGWTLTAAQDVVLAEPDWVPGKNEQLLDRVHRIGQTGDHVVGHVPIVPDTLDERILSTVIRKDKAIFEALDKE